jgi:hypothetical protein
MKTKLSAILFSIFLLALGANAQQTYGGRELSGIKSDFKAVGAVAHVKIDKIELAADDVHPLYKIESAVIETFKGKMKKGKFVFYFHAEEGYNVQQLAGKEFVIFLESEAPVPGGGNGWYELENSKIPASVKLSAELKKKPGPPAPPHARRHYGAATNFRSPTSFSTSSIVRPISPRSYE